MTRPTKEQIERIRRDWEGTCAEQDDLLAEIDALQKERDYWREQFVKLDNDCASRAYVLDKIALDLKNARVALEETYCPYCGIEKSTVGPCTNCPQGKRKST